MNLIVKDLVESLRHSDDPRDKSHATIIEMMSSQDLILTKIETQTTKTNGRVTKQEDIVKDIQIRLLQLEDPAKHNRWLRSLVVQTIAAAVAVLGLLFAFMATPLGGDLFKKRDETKDEVMKDLIADILKDRDAKKK